MATDYRSRDPDSSLYARLSGDLAQQPPSRWIAPEWRGAWNFQGLFREHPVGILLPSVLLIRAGVPGDQAAYIVNMLYQAAVIALIPLVAGLLVSRMEARSLAWVLQLLPVSFAYRIRGNQEHPLLMCFLALLYSTHRARTNAWWVLAMTMSFCLLVLVKGAFAMFALVGAVLWLVVVPPPEGGSNRPGVGRSRRGRDRRGADDGRLRSALRARDGRVVPRVLPVDAFERVDAARRPPRRAARARQRGMVSPQARLVRRPVEPRRGCGGVGMAPFQGHRRVPAAISTNRPSAGSCGRCS